MSSPKPKSDFSTAECLTFEERPLTPHNIRKFRKSYFSEPGTRVTHFGVVDDEAKLREQYEAAATDHEQHGGRKAMAAENARKKVERLRMMNEKPSLSNQASTGSNQIYPAQHCSTLAGVFHQIQSGSFEDYLREKKESIYYSHQREPLGKPFVRGHRVNVVDKQVNAKAQNGQVQAKALIYMGSAQDECPETDAKTRELYVKSHASYRPGEQKCRNYEWNGIDPKNHRFGAQGIGKGKGTDKEESVAACLQPSIGVTGNPSKTIIANRTVEVFKQMNTEPLGKSKVRGYDQNLTWKTKRDANDISAEDCIRGSYSEQDQRPDSDLGKATRIGWRNQPPRDEDTGRAFGCPTVRTDIPAPSRRSIGDDKNYGDDTNAEMLLYPSRFSNIGIEDTDFLVSRNKDQLRKLFASIGHELADEEFEKIFARAQANIAFTNAGEVSIHDFRLVLNEKLDADDAGTVPGWW